MKISRAVALLLAFALLACAVFVSVSRKPAGTHRTVFYFPSMDTDKLCTEVRYLPDDPVQGDLSYYVDELLLGPMTNRYKFLFSLGTKAEFCSLEDDVLYLGLSKDALFKAKDSVDIKTGIKLLRVNIVKQFTEIKTVLVYIDGKSVFEER